MVLGNLFQQHESLVAVDIGASGVKLIEFDTTGAVPRLVNIGVAPLSQEVFTNNVLSNADPVSDQLMGLLESNAIENKRVVTAMPGPSVFTKKVKMPKMDPSDLSGNIELEAGNFIPHNIDAVRLDFHVVGEVGRNQLEILVVAVKNEIIDSYLDCLSLAALETAVVDVDYFALQNIYELSYPELVSDTVVLINIGSRYSSLNICREGQSLFTGDITIGGKQFTEAIASELGVSEAEAEELKLGGGEESKQGAVKGVVDATLEQVANEFNRQLSFFWNASGADDGIDRIMITGGGSLVPGLVEEFSEKTGIECERLDPFKVVDCEDIDESYIKDMAPRMAICAGLGIRQPGDKEMPEWD
jgi:type IV pilus assembly protein PilM